MSTLSQVTALPSALSLVDGLQSGSVLTELEFQQAVELVEALISLIKDTNTEGIFLYLYSPAALEMTQKLRSS